MTSSSSQVAIAVSSPGGMARQYRVQYRSRPNTDWRMGGIFKNRESAQKCLEQFQKNGQLARLVSYGICPAAG